MLDNHLFVFLTILLKMSSVFQGTFWRYVSNQQENADLNYFFEIYRWRCIGWCWHYFGLVRSGHRSWRSIYRKDGVEGHFICCPVSKCCDNMSQTLGVGTHRPGNICPLYISSLGRFIQGINRPVWRVIQEMYNTRDASSKNKYAGTQRSETHRYGIVQNLLIYNSVDFNVHSHSRSIILKVL